MVKVGDTISCVNKDYSNSWGPCKVIEVSRHEVVVESIEPEGVEPTRKHFVRVVSYGWKEFSRESDGKFNYGHELCSFVKV